MFMRTCSMPAAVCLLVTIGLEEPPAAASFLPFESPRGHLILVRGTIGVEPVRFLLDTGTYRTVLDRRIAEKLGLRGTPDAMEVFGQTVPAERVDLPLLRVGPIRTAGLSVLVADLSGLGTRLGWHIDAIVGLDVLRGNCLVVDYPRRSLHFNCTDGWTASAACDVRSPYLVTTATIEGWRYRLLVDTGSDALALFEGRATAHPRNDSHEAVAADNLAGTVRLKIFVAASVRIGGTDLGGQPVVVSAGSDALGYDGLIGVRRLGRRVQLDLKRLIVSWQP